MIYTTNAVEGLHRQIRKVTKTKGSFTSPTALENTGKIDLSGNQKYQ